VRILIVDDDEAIRLLLSTQLRGLGYEVETAADGFQAWTRLQNRFFDLLVCDWNMPVMDGLELCRKIREAEWPSYVYVVLCTAMNQKADFLAGMEAGADDFIVKPFDFADLRVIMRAAQRILDLQTRLTAQNKNLEDLYQKLRKAYGTIENDLEAAAAIQLELLPKKIDAHRQVSLDWLMIPSSFLAGDMLNYFFLDYRKLVLYHLDVAGHGIPAALLSMMLNRTLMPVAGSPLFRSNRNNQLQHIASPVEVVTELNRRYQREDDSYFTMIYGVFDTETRVFQFCQAGHPGPLLLSPDGGLQSLGSGGFPVGMLPEMDYEQQEVTIAPGSRLILYSDGITECLNAQGQRYSTENLQSLLKQQARNPLREMVEAVDQDILQWRNGVELSDDVSMLIMEAL
jgi:phosphoserine phosphatase RsbU/P